MTIAAGSRLGSYEVLAPLGAGGMGEVWRARDGKLGRDVAIKVLPEAFAADPERLARFRREAQVLAVLNHPHIAAIYGLEETGGVEALVLKLVEGETLAERLARGPIPVEEALEIARQIAEALEAAHEKGIVHRDLKPANIKITPARDGEGARLRAGEGADEQLLAGRLDLADADGGGDQAGVILGTAAYMSPEQARGKSVDKRADIWAFGVVLFEMLTGRRLFEGETVSDTLAAVLRQEIEWTELSAGTPASIHRLLARCVERDPRKRLHDVADARLEIEAALAGPPEPVRDAGAGPPAPSRRAARLAPWAVALAFAALALWQARAGRQDRGELVTLSLALPAGLELETQSEAQTQQIAISPDGRRLAFFARWEVRERSSSGSSRATRSSRSSRLPTAEASFSRRTESGSGSRRAASSRRWPSAAERRWLAPAGQSRGAAWAPDGTIISLPTVNSPLLRVAGARGGQPQPVTRLDTASGERTHRWPEILPDGDTVLFTVGTQDKPGDYADAHIDAVSLSTGKRHTVCRGAAARYAAPGYLLLARNDSLLAARFDPGKAEVLGTPTPVLQKLGGDPRSGVAFFGRRGTERSPGSRESPRRSWRRSCGSTGRVGSSPRESRRGNTRTSLSPRTAGSSPVRGRRRRRSRQRHLDHRPAARESLPAHLRREGRLASLDAGRKSDRSLESQRRYRDPPCRRRPGSPEILWKPTNHVPLRPDAFTPDGSRLLLSQFGLPNRGNILLLPARAGSTASPFDRDARRRTGRRPLAGRALDRLQRELLRRA